MKLLTTFSFLFISLISIGQSVQRHGPDEVYLPMDLVEGKNNRIFLSTNGGLYYSNDFAETWQRVKATMNTIYFNPVLAVDRGTGDLFAGDLSGIFSSADNGVTWKMRKLIPDRLYISLKVMDINRDTLWIGTHLGLLYTTLKSLASDVIEIPFFNSDVITGVHADGRKVFTSTRDHGLFRSDDGGRNWLQVNGGLPGNFNADGLLVTTKLWLVYGRDGTWSSADKGATWQKLNMNSPFIWELYNDNGQLWSLTGSYQGIWRQGAGDSWTELNSGLPDTFYPQTILAHGENVVIAGTGGIYRSTNGGSDYTPAFRGVQDGFSFNTLDVASDGSLWTTASSMGVYRMAPGENTFKPFLKGMADYSGGILGDDSLVIVRDKRVDFVNALTGVYSEPNLSDMISQPIGFARGWGDLFVITEVSGLFRYHDNVWAPWREGLSNSLIWQILFHNDRLYAATNDGLFSRGRNDDQWTQIPFSYRSSGVYRMLMEEDLYIVSTSSSLSYISYDAGAHWKEILDLTDYSIGSFTSHDGRIYAAAYQKLFVSSPDKQSWTSYDLPDIMPTALRMHDDRLYIATWERGIWSFDQAWFQRKPQEILTDEEYYQVNKNTPFEIKASASSGLPVSFEIVSGPADLTGPTLTMLSDHIVRVDVYQEGNDEYLPARKQLQFFIDEVTAVSETNESISVFPNPTTDELFVKDASMTHATVSLVDMQGRVLHKMIHRRSTYQHVNLAFRFVHGGDF
ncbi:MAG: hypothetical protein QM762_24850 [Chryseolinea sp.]